MKQSAGRGFSISSSSSRLLFGCLLLLACGIYAVNLYHLTLCDADDDDTSIVLRGGLIKTDFGRDDDVCKAEYKRTTKHSRRTSGLTVEDLERSRAFLGNRQRLAKFSTKLSAAASSSPVNVVVFGGSISLGHGVTPISARYSDQLQVWLNDYYPISTGTSSSSNQHRVYNMGSHGADMCAMAKRMNLLDLPENPDMFILEFAVNDYQGQDHKIHIDHKTDVFFDGFRELAVCAETVVHKLLTEFPDAAVMFLEFQTAILNRKTAQALHMGVAQHYQVPVISYADTMFPEFYRLVDKLKPYDYSVPEMMDIDNVLPYPHGCTPCQPEHISKQFRSHGCKSVCVYMKRSGRTNVDCDTAGGQPCFVPFLAHDAVHPSAIGHQIARDLIVEAIAQTALLTCQGRTFPDHLLPIHSGWMIAGSNYHDELRARSDFVLVQDTMQVFANRIPLVSDNHTSGFEMKGDQLADRKGWIATNPAGGESITFDIDLAVGECYAVYLAVLKSYENVGTFTVTVEDTVKKTMTKPPTIDCIWEPHISIPSDIQLTGDDPKAAGCTGKCKVKITTNPKPAGRAVNKVKIMTLSVRKCIPTKAKS